MLLWRSLALSTSFYFFLLFFSLLIPSLPMFHLQIQNFPFLWTCKKKKNQPLHTVLYTKTNTKQGLASCKACSWAGLILNTWTSASRMQQEHLPKHPALSSHPLALCIREVCIVLSEKWNKKTLQWSWNSPEYLHLENKFMLQIHL